MTNSNNNGGNGRAVAQRPQRQAQAPIEGTVISTSLVATLPDERRLVLTKQLAPGASEAELEYFLLSALRNKLDAFAVPTQIAAMPSRVNTAHRGQPDNWVTKFTPVVMIDGWRKKLTDTGRVEDMELEWCGEDLVWRDVWADGKALVAARASIYLIGRQRPVRFVAHLDEFIKYKQGSNEPTDFWKRTRHMLAIRALSHCAKQALVGIQLFDPEMLGEEEDELGTDHGMAQRRFWAAGWKEETVRQALHLPEGGSLAEAIDHFGGYAKLESYMARIGETVASLPAPDPNARASDLLYGPSQHQDPLTAQASPTAAEARAELRLDPAEEEDGRRRLAEKWREPDGASPSAEQAPLNSEIDSAPRIRCSVCGADASFAPNGNGMGARCAEHRPTLDPVDMSATLTGEPPGVDALVDPDADDAPTDPELCNVCGQSPPAGMTPEGVLACQDCVDQAEAADPAARERAPMPVGAAIPVREDAPTVPLPDDIHDLTGFVLAADALLSLSRVEIGRRLPGKQNWQNVARPEMERRWAQIQALTLAETSGARA